MLQHTNDAISPLEYKNYDFAPAAGQCASFIENFGIEPVSRFAIQTDIFLSVVVRTQGNRPVELAETLLCLSAQQDRDFEVIIIAHKVPENLRDNLFGLIDAQPDYLRSRIRLLWLDEGNRSTPLNYGFSHSKGRYVAILDDDDLVLDSWVSSFKKRSKTADGAILRSYAVTQQWERNNGDLCAVSAPNPLYCHPFDYIFHLRENRSPAMTLAYPVSIVQSGKVKFDESLDTTEDWDFLMKVLPFSGLADIQEVTSIYRLWKNAESSWTLHSEQDWESNHKTVQNRLASNPVLLPAGYSANLVAMFDELKKYTDLKNSLAPGTARLYLPEKEQPACTAKDTGNGKYFSYSFRRLSGISDYDRQWLRIDPSEQGMQELNGFTARLRDVAGNWMDVPSHNLRCNGYATTNSMIFIADDPQVYVYIPEGFLLDEIYINGNFSPLSGWQDIIQQDIGLQPDLYIMDESEWRPSMDTAANKKQWPEFCFEYLFNSSEFRNNDIIIRFDPVKAGGFVLQNFRCSFISEAGDKLDTDSSHWRTVNGANSPSGFLFPLYDPQLHFDLPANFVPVKAVFSGKIQFGIPDQRMQQMYAPPNSALAYLDYGDGFSQQNSVELTPLVSDGKFSYTINIPEDEELHSLRFDPAEYEGFAVKNLSAVINGSYAAKTGLSNAVETQGYLLFLRPDPQIEILIPKNEKATSITLTGEFFTTVPEEIVQVIGRPSLAKRIVRKIRNLKK